jgi:hypothetical protein
MKHLPSKVETVMRIAREDSRFKLWLPEPARSGSSPGNRALRLKRELGDQRLASCKRLPPRPSPSRPSTRAARAPASCAKTRKS